jgi:glycosyltransferase involved in cell wall biosynthesis
MASQSSLDIIIIGYNEGTLLRDCIHSAKLAAAELRDRTGIPALITYVDSDSTDSSVALARAEGLPVLRAPPGYRTPANARNTGMFLTHGDFVQFLDGDMTLELGWLPAGIAFLSSRSDVAGVAGYRDDIRPTALGPLHIKNYYKSPAHALPAGDSLGGAFLFHRRALEAIRGFNPACHEEELYAKMAFADLRLGLYRIPHPMIVHHDEKIATFRQKMENAFGVRSRSQGQMLRHAFKSLARLRCILYAYRWIFLHLSVLFVLGLGGAVWKFSTHAGNELPFALAAIASIYTLWLIYQREGIYRGGFAWLALSVEAINLVIYAFLPIRDFSENTEANTDYLAKIEALNRMKSTPPRNPS